MRPGALLCVALGALALAACAPEDVVARRQGGCTDAGDCAPASTPLTCAAPVPVISIGDAPCAGPLVERFQFGLCTCEGYVSDRPLVVSPPGDGADLGSLGVNGSLNATGGLSLSGSLVVAGSEGIVTGQDAPATISGDLASAGGLSGGGAIDIGADARVGGDIGVGSLRVGGTLTTEPGATVSVTGTEEIAARRTASVTVPLPCACDAPSRPDLVGAVHAHRTDNDNRAIGLGAFDLEAIDAPTTLELPCGRYHVSGIRGSGSLTLRTSGHVVLFVDGAISLDGSLIVTGSEGLVELVVEETVRLGGALGLGAEGPGPFVHLAVAGGDVFQVGGAIDGTGAVYAPDAELVTTGEVNVRGALLVRRIVAAAPIWVEQDAALAACPAAR
jgi:hypothetical protein